MPQTILQVANSALIKIGARQIATLGEATKEAENVTARIRGVRDMMLRSHVWTFARKHFAMVPVTADLGNWTNYFVLPADCLRLLAIYDSGHTAIPIGELTTGNIIPSTHAALTDYREELVFFLIDNTYYRNTGNLGYLIPASGAYTLPATPASHLVISPAAKTLGVNVTEYEIVGRSIYTDTTTLSARYVRQPQTANEGTDTYPDDFAEAWASYLAAEISTVIFDSPERREAFLAQYEVILRQARFTGAVEQADTAITAVDQWIDSRASSNYGDRALNGLDAPPGGI
jgi:hypothetical protein